LTVLYQVSVPFEVRLADAARDGGRAGSEAIAGLVAS
jgi:hypothetical protein